MTPTGRRDQLVAHWSAGALVAVGLLLWIDALAGGSLVDDGFLATLVVAWLGYLAGSRTPVVPLVLVCLADVLLLAVADQLVTKQFSLASDGLFYLVLVAGPALAGWLIGSRSRQVTELRRLSTTLGMRREVAAQVARYEEAERVERAVDLALADRLGAIIGAVDEASRLLAAGPAAAPPSLSTAETIGREALGELREVLGVLRPGVVPQREAPEPVRVTTSSRHPFDLVDLLLVLSAVPLAVETSVGESLSLVGLNVAASIGQGLLLSVVRRHAAIGVAALVLLATAQTALLTPLPPTVSWAVPALLATYLAGLQATRRLAPPVLAALLAGLVGLVTIATPAADRALDGMVPGVVMGVLAWWAGRTVRAREARLAELRSLVRELERTRDAHVRLAAAEQRAAMARELHDVGAHALTVICLQAGAAQTMWHRDRAQALEAIAAMQMLADDSLTHLRSSLGELADDETTTPLDVAALDVLIGIGRVLGLDVVVDVVGEPQVLSREVARAAFRVVQEGLTNAARHAAHGTVEIGLRYSDDGLEIGVTDRGPGLQAEVPATLNGSGVGLRGMRERVEACRGEFACGPRAGGGFAVHARLPLAVTT